LSAPVSVALGVTLEISATPGTEGYAEQATVLIDRYNSEAFPHKHRHVLHLIPNGPGRALDVGSGTGTDAAWLAHIGYHVVAVEPVLAFREAAARIHTSASIEWLDDALPELARVAARGTRFNLVMLTAVWMHLNPAERARAFMALRVLLAPDALLFMSVRNGPVSHGRRMFPVPPGEVLGQAHFHGLKCLFHATTESSQPLNIAAGVTWEKYAFQAQRGDA